MKRSGLIILAIVAVLVIWGISVQRGLVGVDEDVKRSWSNVQTEYQRRSDLVDQLVSTVKGAANFEQKTLTDVVNARARATSVNINAENLTPEKIAEFQAAQGQLSGSLSRLLATVEAYPTLRATENFTKLQNQLEEIENSTKNARRTFNETVQVYNVKIRRFPANIMAGILGYRVKPGFQADPGTEKAPKVNF